MSELHPWAVNEIKLARAITELKKAGNPTPSDEDIKAKYVLYGGKVIEDNVSEEAEEEKPKKGKK